MTFLNKSLKQILSESNCISRTLEVLLNYHRKKSFKLFKRYKAKQLAPLLNFKLTTTDPNIRICKTQKTQLDSNSDSKMRLR